MHGKLQDKKHCLQTRGHHTNLTTNQRHECHPDRKSTGRARERHPTASKCCLQQTMERELRESQKAPKAQTPHHCTGRSRASSSLTAPKGYKIPHSLTRGLHAGPWSSKIPRVLGGNITRPVPRTLERPEPLSRRASPYSKIFEAKSTSKNRKIDPVRFSEMSGDGFSIFDPSS